jgi:hypothetical protein
MCIILLKSPPDFFQEETKDRAVWEAIETAILLILLFAGQDDHFVFGCR